MNGNSKSNSSAASSRRRFLQGAGAAVGFAASFWADEDLQAYQSHVNTRSNPSDLKITDLRVAVVARAPMTCPLIRIDTNQGIYGLGEVRDGASKTYALMLKSRLLGENPCNVDRVFRKIKQFGVHLSSGRRRLRCRDGAVGPGRQSVQRARLPDAGGKFRDKMRAYADTDESPDPHEYARRLKERMDLGFTWLKMDLAIELIKDRPGMLSHPLGVDPVHDTRETRTHVYRHRDHGKGDRGAVRICSYRREKLSVGTFRFRTIISDTSA